MTTEDARGFEFPCDYQIKAMGHDDGHFHQVVLEIVARHCKTIRHESLNHRKSRGGKYVSVSLVIEATSPNVQAVPLENFVRRYKRVILARPDWLSHLGVAREVAALTGAALRLPDTSMLAEGAPVDDQVKIEIEDIIGMINDMGIQVYETAPDADALLLSNDAVTPDEDAAEEAAAVLGARGGRAFQLLDPGLQIAHPLFLHQHHLGKHVRCPRLIRHPLGDHRLGVLVPGSGLGLGLAQALE